MPKNQNKLGNGGCGKPLILLDITVLSPIETALSGRLNKPARRIVRYLSFNIISAGARFNFQSTAFPKDEGKLETGL
jgi:hypothetical protein